ncbi:Ndg [Bugula neritina]|uniref:Ndg n=1 Tax=Bugula neritina TaxID=10212 RepID=A0A7J7KK68_BUGNE|nr:Ndg [Bugula neritina]
MAGVIKSWLAMLACAFLTWSNLHAASVDQFYPYGITIDESLDIGDDVASDKYNLDIPIVFYSQRKSEVWISTNGLISFDGPLKEYAGELFPLGREVVAPFYADIDTTSSGDVFYRETKEEAELNQAASDISKVFRPDEAFQPASLLIVTWVNVGAFYQRFTKLNTFQLVIATDAFRSYAFFIYMDNSINWIQADLKPEIAEVSAQAGFDSGAQQYGPIVVPGSGFEEALNWDKESNTGIPGVWMYKIGYLTVIEQPEVNIMTTTPSPALPGPDTNECPQGCSANAVCIEGCCVCKLGYYGNGISCLGDDALWVNGKVYGTVNEEDISNAGMYVYVAVDEARTYTAISKLPPLTGYPLQILVILGELMGWLFAAASTGTSENGFSITGGIMNYSATMDFGSERVRLDVEMSGVTSDGTPQDMQIPPKDMIVRITGTLPVNTVGSQATYKDYVADYTKTQPGEYRSEASRSYFVDNKEYQFDVTEMITFKSAPLPRTSIV